MREGDLGGSGNCNSGLSQGCYSLGKSENERETQKMTNEMR